MNNKEIAISFYADYIEKFPCAVYSKGKFKWYSSRHDIATIAINKKLWMQ